MVLHLPAARRRVRRTLYGLLGIVALLAGILLAAPRQTVALALSPTPAPTRSSLLGLVNTRPGVILNLRLGPDSASPVLARMPYGSSVQVYGRTADTIWLKVGYGDKTGWTMSRFVLIRLDGRDAALNTVPPVDMSATVTKTPGK